MSQSQIVRTRISHSFFFLLSLVPDSPGVPPSATAHELFRGFSYVAPPLIQSPAAAMLGSGDNSLCAAAGGESTDTVVEVSIREAERSGR